MAVVLLVEDDEGMVEFETLELEHEGYQVLRAATGREALSLFEKNPIDAVLLDIMLPELSGMEVLRRIRKTSLVPVILVTARGETIDKVAGLNAGADDYLAKPFEIEELLARMQAVLRRSQRSQLSAAGQQGQLQWQGGGESRGAETDGNAGSAGGGSVHQFRDLVMNTESMEVTLQGKPIELSRTEYLLLKCFLTHTGVVLGRDEIINAVWGENHTIEPNAVDVYVRYLRSKIARVTTDDYIFTVRGSGYVMKGE